VHIFEEVINHKGTKAQRKREEERRRSVSGSLGKFFLRAKS